MAGLGRSHVHGHKGEDLEAARPCRGPGRDARLRLPEAGRAAPERQEGDRRRHHVEEAAPDAVRRSSSSRSSSSTPRPVRRSPRAARISPAPRSSARPSPRPSSSRSTRRSQELAAPAGAADREREEAARQDRGLPHQEGGHQGAVLRRRGAGEDLRGRQRGGRGDGRPRAGDPARRGQDRADARPRAGAVEELEAAGTFDDLSQLGGGQDDIDRELAQLGAGGAGGRRAGRR